MAEADARAALVMAHEFQVERMIAGISNDAVRRLRALQRDLEVAIRTAAPQEPSARRFREQRLGRLADEVRDLIRAYQRASRREMERDAVELVDQDFDGLAAVFLGLAGADILRSRLSRADARKLIRNGRFLGIRWRDWHAQHADGVMRRALQAVGIGVENRETMRSLIARTRAALSVSIQGVEFMAKTVSSGIFNAARTAVFDLNRPRVPAIQVITTFDSRTSAVSLTYAGGVWSRDTGLPLTSSRHRLRFPGPLPWHPNERCRLLPVPVGARPIRVPSVVEFLRDQPDAFVLQHVGKRKTELLRAGTISPRQLLDFRRRPISLRRMREAGEISR